MQPLLSQARSALLLCFLFFIFSCVENTKQANSDQFDESSIRKNSRYQILKIEPHETSFKAQVKCIAVITTDTLNKEIIKADLISMYNSLKNYNKFSSFSKPTVVAIYLYTSKDMAEKVESSWIAYLLKSPSEYEPRISIDEEKIEALNHSNGGTQSDDDIMFEKLQTIFRKRGTDLCTLYLKLYDIEGETIKAAEAKHPDLKNEYLKYQSELYHQEQHKLLSSYKISDTVASYISVFGLRYCK